MKKLLENIIKNHNKIFQIAIVVIFSLLISFLVSNKTNYSFDFEKGSSWHYDDLYAGFSFSIFKTDAEIQKNKKDIEFFSDVYYEKDTLLKHRSISNFELDLKSKLRSKNKVEKFYKTGSVLLTKIFNNGIIELRESDSGREKIQLISPEFEKYNFQNVKKVSLSDFLTMEEAISFIKSEIKFKLKEAQILEESLIESLDYDVIFNEHFTNLILEEEFKKISLKRGLVQKGELIIKKNQLIDENSFQKLYSYQKELGVDINKSDYFLLISANFFLVFLILILCFLLLFNFYKNLIVLNANFLFIFSTILFFIVLATVVISINKNLIFAIPFCIIPLTLRSFFDFRLSLFIHFFIIIIVSFLCQKSQLFIVLNFLAGFAAIINSEKIYTQSQLFFAIIRIVFVYLISFFSISILVSGSINQIDFSIIIMLFLSGVLTFLTFPFIYVCEKIFSLVSDLSLLEYADTNRSLLRKLAKDAPGTFHHSLQVSHLCEAVAIELGANPLLVRAGALYHDIGKLENPNFFIENQVSGINPHDDLSFDESAEVIINHVSNGIEIAKSSNLPDQLIDFIRTHHGDYLMQYFYREYLKNFPDDVNESKFRYPGPRPFSKETAILMMCDSVEAASRSLKKTDTNSMDKIVEQVISSQLLQGQYDNSSLTFKEIKQIKNILKLKLRDIHHARITYPE